MIGQCISSTNHLSLVRISFCLCVFQMQYEFTICLNFICQPFFLRPTNVNVLLMNSKQLNMRYITGNLYVQKYMTRSQLLLLSHKMCKIFKEMDCHSQKCEPPTKRNVLYVCSYDLQFLETCETMTRTTFILISWSLFVFLFRSLVHS